MRVTAPRRSDVPVANNAATAIQRWIPPTPHPRHALNLLILTNLTCTMPPANAVDFTWTPRAQTQMRLSDNIRSSATDPESAWGFDTGAGVGLRAETETLTTDLIPRFNLVRFVVGDNLDADEYSVTFNNDWTQEIYSAALDFSYARDSTLTTEETELGRINDVVDRDSIELRPSVSWAINDRWAAQGSFLFNDVSYIDAENTGFSDYQYMQASTGLTHTWDSTTLIFGTVFVSDFEVPDSSSTTRSYGGQAGITKQLSPTFEATGAVGYISSNIEFVEQQLAVVFDPLPRFIVLNIPNEVTASGPIATVSLRKSFETISTQFDYTRQVSPSGRGAQSTSDRIEFHADKRMTERFTLAFNGYLEMRATEGDQQTAGLGQSVALDRDLTELRGTARYQLTRDWVLSASYAFRHRKSTRTDQGVTADSNGVYLAIIFNGLAQPLLGSY